MILYQIVTWMEERAKLLKMIHAMDEKGINSAKARLRKTSLEKQILEMARIVSSSQKTVTKVEHKMFVMSPLMGRHTEENFELEQAFK